LAAVCAAFCSSANADGNMEAAEWEAAEAIEAINRAETKL